MLHLNLTFAVNVNLNLSSVSSKTVINDGEGGFMRDLRCFKILIFRKEGLKVLLKKRQKSAFIQMVKPFTKETEDSYKTKQF